MAWLRLDEHLPENRKVQSLAPELFKLWVNLLCICKATDGKLQNLDQISFRLRTRWTKFLRSLEELASSGLLDETQDALGKTYSIHDWEDWQYKSDLSTQRVRRFRETSKKRNETVSRNGLQRLHETPLSASASVSVSVSASGGKNLPQFGGEFPLTIAEIRRHDEAVDDFFVASLAQKVTQYCMSHPKFPQEKLEKINDSSLSKACAHSYQTWNKKGSPHGTGLLLNRVPAIIMSWAQEV